MGHGATPPSDAAGALAAAALALAAWALLARRRRGVARAAGATRLHLVRDAHGNEALVVDARLARASRTLFMVDSAYAGAPVLSTSLLAVEAEGERGAAHGDVAARYRRTVERLRRGVTDAARHAAVHRLLASGRCRAYTSGCTMRLMGIGATTETQADMLLCPALELDGRAPDAYVDADVVVTHPLPHTPHILTVDYLLHRAPCAILPRAGLLRTRLHGAAALAEARGLLLRRAARRRRLRGADGRRRHRAAHRGGHRRGGVTLTLVQCGRPAARVHAPGKRG